MIGKAIGAGLLCLFGLAVADEMVTDKEVVTIHGGMLTGQHCRVWGFNETTRQPETFDIPFQKGLLVWSGKYQVDAGCKGEKALGLSNRCIMAATPMP